MTHCDRCHKECSDDEPQVQLDGSTKCYSCRERQAIQAEEKTK